MSNESIQWAVQTNLGSDIYTGAIEQACRELGFGFYPFMAIPFSDDLPDVPNNIPTIFYGATRLTSIIHDCNKWSPGVFFDKENFKFSAYRKNLSPWDFMDPFSDFVTLREAASQDHRPDEELIFIRPDADLKEFPGEVMTRATLKAWFSEVEKGCYALPPDCPVMVSEPCGIPGEWRFFIVNGEIVASSQYKRDGRLHQYKGAPELAMKKAIDVISTWTPASVCVLDIGGCDSHGYYIVEFNCFNSAGFYEADVSKIINAVSRHALG